MQKYRFSVSFVLASLLYAGVGFLLFYYANVHIGIQQKPKEKIITLSMSAFIPISPPFIEEKIPPKEEEPEVVEPESKPIKEEIQPEPIVEEVKSAPIVKKVIPKPRVKKIVKKKVLSKKIVKKKTQKKKSKKTAKKHVKKRVHTNSHKKYKKRTKSVKAQASPAKKNRFLNQLRAKINRYKAYPRIAQRRGMQGTVKVRFTILANGQVGNISVSGPKVFHTSAKGAVKKAFPIVTKNAPLSLPTTVNLTLRYQIR